MRESEEHFSSKPLPPAHEHEQPNRDLHGDRQISGNREESDLIRRVTTPAYRSTFTLALLATVVLCAGSILNLFSAFSTIAAMPLVNGARFGVPVPLPQAEDYDTRQRWLAWCHLGFWIAGFLLFLMWVFRFSRNTRALGALGLSYTPAWSVGWFFVPVMSLWMPLRVFNELWRANQAELEEDWVRTPVSPLLGAWWILCIVASCIHYEPWQAQPLAGIAELGRHWADSLWSWSWGFLAWNLVGLATNVLTMIVIVRMTELQQRKRVKALSHL